MTIDELAKIVLTLKREFEDHRHTGLDSLPVETTIQTQGALTAQDSSTVDTTYGAEEAGVINNNRLRIQQIETALQNVGVLS